MVFGSEMGVAIPLRVKTVLVSLINWREEIGFGARQIVDYFQRRRARAIGGNAQIVSGTGSEDGGCYTRPEIVDRALHTRQIILSSR